jgi:phosphatidylethanolamine/phosphatidyl-N-methylethanolamine N-methyltransferase
MKTIKKLAIGLIAAVSFIISSYIAICVAGGSSVSESVLFLARFIASPRDVGAVAPSSQLLARALVAYVTPGNEREGKRFLEVGPGTGAVTQELIRNMGPCDTLDLVEIDKNMADMLKKKYAHNPSVTVYHGSITDWKPEYLYSTIVMGIPFNALPFGVVQDIWAHCRTLICDCGVISYFSYLWLPDIKKAVLPPVEREEFVNIQWYLAQQFQQCGFDMKRVWANVPPAAVWYLRISN